MVRWGVREESKPIIEQSCVSCWLIKSHSLNDPLKLCQQGRGGGTIYAHPSIQQLFALEFSLKGKKGDECPPRTLPYWTYTHRQRERSEHGVPLHWVPLQYSTLYYTHACVGEKTVWVKERAICLLALGMAVMEFGRSACVLHTHSFPLPACFLPLSICNVTAEVGQWMLLFQPGSRSLKWRKRNRSKASSSHSPTDVNNW